MINLQNSLLVIFGSAIGGGCRFWISTWIQQLSILKFPFGTFIVNMLGCLAIGMVVALNEKNNANQTLMLLLATGFCGGFTTFSAFALENMQLIKNGLNIHAGIYITASIFIGIVAVKLGMSMLK